MIILMPRGPRRDVPRGKSEAYYARRIAHCDRQIGLIDDFILSFLLILSAPLFLVAILGLSELWSYLFG